MKKPEAAFKEALVAYKKGLVRFSESRFKRVGILSKYRAFGQQIMKNKLSVKIKIKAKLEVSSEADFLLW